MPREPEAKTQMLLKRGDAIRIRHLDVEGVCTRFTRDESGDVAAGVAYADNNRTIHKTVLAIVLLQVKRPSPGGSNPYWQDVTGIQEDAVPQQ